ncbi:hypothetical protein [Bradyrhizobium diazoefficiens]|uniref:hypothetical protein n=1 Tax=Bradyrhizobium diazoefficiens TaxID=1355477 RepID=UPI001B5C895E|nr:hypothetical protein [Bradyrhizobium japonicum]
MPHAKLGAALTAVNWNGNVAALLSDVPITKAISARNLRVAIWAKQLEISDYGNPALCFVREMQIAGQHVAVLMALALYKPAAACMRTMLETGLYYSYFRTHQSELATLVRDPEYFVDKKALLEYHKNHTPNFVELQRKLGVVSRLETWYSRVSAVVHGQIPGAWMQHQTIAEIAPNKATQNLTISEFQEGEEILHRLFLCTVGRLLWDTFSVAAKKELLRGLPGALKAALALDAA